MTGATDDQIRTWIREAEREHWRKLQGEPARQPHRAKAEAAFGVGLVDRMCKVAPRASDKHIAGRLIAEVARQQGNARAVVAHLKKALALADESREMWGSFGWKDLADTLEPAIVAAAAVKRETAEVQLPKRTRSRGAPSLRARFVELAKKQSELGSLRVVNSSNPSRLISSTDWAHLGIAVGIDEPTENERKFKQMREDYRRLLERVPAK